MIIVEFLKFGYLGFLAMSIYLCYRIIAKSNNSRWPFRETMIVLCIFLLTSGIGGFAGYFWASKELEVAKVKETTASILKQQVVVAREAHIKAMEPLQKALDEVSRNLTSSVLSSTRQEYIAEINQINTEIQARESLYLIQIKALKDVFNQESK